jgi:hypothetical protein
MGVQREALHDLEVTGKQCKFEIMAYSPGHEDQTKTFEWNAPCTTSFHTVHAASLFCQRQHNLNGTYLKAEGGANLGMLSCSNQAWSIHAVHHPIKRSGHQAGKKPKQNLTTAAKSQAKQRPRSKALASTLPTAATERHINLRGLLLRFRALEAHQSAVKFAQNHPAKAGLVLTMIVFVAVMGCSGSEHKLSAEAEKRMQHTRL